MLSHSISFIPTSRLIPQVANTLLIIWLVLSLPKVNRLHIFIKIILMLVIAILLNCIPIYHGLNISLYLRGIIADLSITTLCILSLAILNILVGFKQRDLGFNMPSAGIISIIAIGLYLSTLGFIAKDIYAWGYYPNFSVMLGFICLELIIYYFSPFNAIVWVIAAFAFYYKLQGSTNFWDYLFDPVLLVIYVVFIIKKFIKR